MMGEGGNGGGVMGDRVEEGEEVGEGVGVLGESGVMKKKEVGGGEEGGGMGWGEESLIEAMGARQGSDVDRESGDGNSSFELLR